MTPACQMSLIPRRIDVKPQLSDTSHGGGVGGDRSKGVQSWSRSL